MISTSFVNATQANTINLNYTCTSRLSTLPPLAGTTPPIYPIFITKANSSGQYVVRRETCQHTCSDPIPTASVRINEITHQGTIFDANGQRINWLSGQLLRVIILLIVWHILMLLRYFNNTFTNPRTFQFFSMRSVIAETGWLNKSEYFRKSTLIKSEIENEYKLGIDSWVDTSCPEKYSDVNEFV